MINEKEMIKKMSKITEMKEININDLHLKTSKELLDFAIDKKRFTEFEIYGVDPTDMIIETGDSKIICEFAKYAKNVSKIENNSKM